MVTNHSVTLSNLTGSTPTLFWVGSIGYGRQRTDSLQRSELYHQSRIRTYAEPQFTSPPTATGKTHNSAIIVLGRQTNPAIAEVQFGTSMSAWDGYTDSENDADMVTFHSVTITGLSGGTAYYFRAGSTDGADNGPAISSEFSLPPMKRRTPPPRRSLYHPR